MTPFRLLHTSDWHLGHTLRDFDRTAEHAAFLRWLLDTLDAREIDALVVTGDVFDAANPPPTALAAFYGFLGAARARRPALRIVVIGGNHDSAARLDGPIPLLDAFGVHMVGGLPRRADRALDLGRLVLPLHDARGNCRGLIAAVPFLRVSDLPPGHDLIEGVRSVYAEVLTHAQSLLEPGQFLVATGHAYMVDGRISELSERKVLGGNQHALPIDVFGADCAYVALGHLHYAQAVGGRETVRYAGSPIPLSMDERTYGHGVDVVTFAESGVNVETVPVPRAVPFVRIPDNGHLSVEEALLAIQTLPAESEQTPAWLEVCVSLDRPEPTLRARVDAALSGRAARLLRLATVYPGSGEALADQFGGADLQSLSPASVFSAMWSRKHAGEPPADALSAFHDAVAAVEGA